MRLREFAARGVIANSMLTNLSAACAVAAGLALAPSVRAANPGEPLTPPLAIFEGAPGQFSEVLLSFGLASSPGGDFVLDWVRGSNPFTNPMAEGRDGLGNPLSTPFPIAYDSATWPPILAADGVGGFTAVWRRLGQAAGITARRFKLSGVALTPESDVSGLDDTLTGVLGTYCQLTDAGSSRMGGYVVSWNCDTLNMPKQYPGPPLFGLYRAFLPTGSALLPEALLDSNVLEDLLLLGKTKGPFESAEPVAVAPDGSFVAAWDGPGGIHLRSFNALGLPLGVDTVVMPGATVTGLALERPGLLGQAKDYLLSWGDSAGFHSQAFDSSNKPLGQEVTFPSNPFAPQPATDANGNYVVVLDDGQQLVAQFFTGYGVARSPAIALPISTDYDAGYGGQYRMASDAQGNFVVAYTRFQVNPDKSVTDTLYAQRFAGME